MRASLGAARRRLVGLLSIEALLLAGCAATRELAIASRMLRAIDALQPPGLDVTTTSLNRAAVVWPSRSRRSRPLLRAAADAEAVATDPCAALQGSAARACRQQELGRFRLRSRRLRLRCRCFSSVLAALFTQSLANIARVDLGRRNESVVTFRVRQPEWLFRRKAAQTLAAATARARGRAGRDTGLFDVALLSARNGARAFRWKL